MTECQPLGAAKPKLDAGRLPGGHMGPSAQAPAPPAVVLPELAMQQMGDIIDNRYQLTRPLGMRREAEMWEAEHQISGRKVTLKIVGRETDLRRARSRVVAEARIAAEISHPSIVEVYDVGITGDSAYLVTEQLRGETLADIITQQGAMQAEDACQVMLQVLAGLEAAHSVKVVHGDLRAESIILRRGRDGQLIVKLLDFGLSAVSEPSARPPVSGSQAAPGFLDPREDIHAVGAILYEMLTGRLGIHQGASRASQANGTSMPPEAAQSLVPAIPAGLARIVDQALAPGSTRSIGSAKEMAGMLAPFAISKRAPALAPRDTLMPFLSPEARRSRGMARLERAVLGLSEPKDKNSVRPNLILIDGSNDAGPRPAERSNERPATEPPHPSLEDLREPRIPRPPRTPTMSDSGARMGKPARVEHAEHSKRPSSHAQRRWRAARPRITTSDLTSLQAAAMNRVMRRIWSAGLLAAAGLGAGLLLGHLLHF